MYENLEQIKKTIENNAIQESNKSYASVVSNNSTKEDLRKIIQEEKKEEKNIKSKSRNLIIHGVTENLNETDKQTRRIDGEFIEEMMEELELPIKKFKVNRIGKRKEKFRPIKLELEQEQDKIEVLKNLTKLENKKIRIIEDLTIKERNLVKEWCDKADKMNENNDDEKFKWRVRGSPRSGLYIKKIYCKTHCNTSYS